MEREEWLKLRKNYIGASDAPVIMNGTHFNKTPYRLWQEKLGLAGGTPDNNAMRYGRDMEEQARQCYERYTGNIMTPQMVFHKTKTFMMATLDGLDFNGEVALEIKCPGAKDHETALKGKVPEKYYPQLQHQLACDKNNQLASININRLHYFSFRDGKGVLIEVERDEAYINTLYKEEGNFWDKVMTLTAPELTERDYQQMENAEWQEVATRWARRQALLKALEEEEKQDRAFLIKMAGDASAIGHGVRVSKILRKGNVDYKAIPQLKGVDLDQYRKKPIESWRIEAVG